MTEHTDIIIPPPGFDGSWEKPGRNPTSAAILGLIIVGIVYAYAQGIIGLIIMGIQSHNSAAQPDSAKTFIDILTARALARKEPLRYSVFIAEFLFMLLPTVWIISRWHTKDVLRYIRFRKTPLFEIFLAILGAILYFPVSAGISNFLLGRLHFPDFLARINSLLFASNTPSELIWVVVAVCVTPAICEETLFRGYVQRTLERKMGARSLFVAGILFGLYHMRPLDLFSLSLFGIMVGFFAYRSKSLLPGMAAHFTNNFIIVLSLYRMNSSVSRTPFALLHIPLIIVLLGAAGTTVLLLIYRNTTSRNFPEASDGTSRTSDFVR